MERGRNYVKWRYSMEVICSCKPLDNATYEMCKDHFEAFTAYLEEEARYNKVLAEILNTKTPWEKGGEQE